MTAARASHSPSRYTTSATQPSPPPANPHAPFRHSHTLDVVFVHKGLMPQEQRVSQSCSVATVYLSGFLSVFCVPFQEFSQTCM